MNYIRAIFPLFEQLLTPLFEIQGDSCGLSDNIVSMLRLQKLLDQCKTQLDAMINRTALVIGREYDRHR